MVKRAQYKIMQMAFLILAVLVFFVLVFLLFVNYSLGGITRNSQQLERDSAISSLYTLVNSPELSCDFIGDSSWCVDEDKVSILSNKMVGDFNSYWSVSSIEILEVFPNDLGVQVKCPNVNCNYYSVFDEGQTEIEKYSVYVNLCKQVDKLHESCSLAKLIVGVQL